MIYVSRLEQPRPPESGAYPFSLPLIAALSSLDFPAPVTILSGGNGSGKTTLLSLLSEKLGAVRVGNNARSSAIRQAAPAFRIVRSRRERRCFAFSAEDFSREIDARIRMRREAEEGLRHVETDFAGHSETARAFAAMPYAGTLYEMNAQYARELAERSHGEGYLDFFGARLSGGGLYLLDEPESALTYFNQLVLLNMIRDAADNNCQFILATHSPVLAACPGAAIYALTPDGIAETAYDALEDVAFLKLFLSDPARFFRG